MTIKLSNRLNQIVKFIPNDKKVADIGTDHGYIPIYLVENNISKKIIASDVNLKPLTVAKNSINKKNYGDIISVELANGIEHLRDKDIDIAIIAGMGGDLIKNILSEDLSLSKRINHYIIQPMQQQRVIREFLYDNKAIILNDTLIKDNNKIYEIINFKFEDSSELSKPLTQVDLINYFKNNNYTEINIYIDKLNLDKNKHINILKDIIFDIGFDIKNIDKLTLKEFIGIKLYHINNLMKGISEEDEEKLESYKIKKYIFEKIIQDKD